MTWTRNRLSAGRQLALLPAALREFGSADRRFGSVRLAVQSCHRSGTNLDQLGLSAADLKAIVSKNAMKLMPRRKAWTDWGDNGIRDVRKLLAAVAIAVAFAAFDKASAQNYPSRPITMVVPFAPGGPTDTIARIIAEHMRGSLGQPVIVENVSGAGGSIGVARVARAAPDGYTLSVGNLSSHVMNGAIYSLQYDLIGDFAPVGLLSFQPLLIVGKKSLPANNLREFLAWLKASSGKATLGIQGIGTAGHVTAIFFQREIGANLTLVPYRGAGPAMQDLIAGQIDCMIDTPTNSLPQVRAGSIKAYAVTAQDHLSSAREIPTVDEAGLPGFHFSFWQALWAPKGTPTAIIEKLNAAVVASLTDQIIRQRFAEQGQDVPPVAQQTPQALGAYHKAEIDKWWPVVKAANIKAE